MTDVRGKQESEQASDNKRRMSLPIEIKEKCVRQMSLLSVPKGVKRYVLYSGNVI